MFRSNKGIYRQLLKRPMDCLLSLVVLVFLSPVLLLVAVMVRLKLGRPVLFKQERPGLNEKIFILYKFRTMTDEIDKNGNFLPDHVRLTPFGKMLRATSLDELPELFNILKGDMLFAGPRPLLVRYLPLYNERQRRRHLVRPGLSGLAQVNGRNAISWEHKFELDEWYVDHVTFIGDWKIIFLTIRQAFGKKGINQEKESNSSYFTGDREDEG